MAEQPEDPEGSASAERSDGSDSVVLGALRHAVAGSGSWTLRSYAVLATLLALFVAALVLLAFPTWVLLTEGSPLDRVGRAFLVLVGLGLVVVMLLPVLFVDRRRRAERPERQVALALAGYGYLASLYLALLASAPPDARSEPPAWAAPVVETLYALPRASGLVVVLAGAALVLAVEYGLDRTE